MALTLEQFKALRAKGLTTEQIARFESGKKPTIKQPVKTGISGFASGAGKGEINTLSNMSQFGQNLLNLPLKGVNKVSNLIAGKDVFNQRLMNQGANTIIPQELRTPIGGAEKAGFATEQIAEYLIPGSASLKAGKAASVATTGGKILKGAAELTATGLTEGILGTGQSALQSGKLGKNELAVGAISTVSPAIMAGGGKVLSKFIPTSLKTKISESITKAIKPSVKSIKNPGYIDTAARGFQVMSKNPIEFDGVFRKPETVSETLTSLKETKKKLYEQYSSIAQKSGEIGAKFSPRQIMADLSNWIKGTGYSADVKEYAQKRLGQLADLENLTPVQIQDRIQELNSGINFFPASGADKIKNQIDATIAVRLRKELDDIILNSTGLPYQSLKSDYAALKTIEDDIARQSAVLARKAEKGFFDITDIFTGGSITSGVLTGNPAAVISGLSGRLLKEYTKYINSPDRYIKNIFKLIDKVPEPNINRVSTQKLLNPGTPGKVVNNVPINLSAKAPSTLDAEQIKKFGGKDLWNNLKNNQQGFAKIPGVKNPIVSQLEESWQKIHDDAVRKNILNKPSIQKALKSIEDQLNKLK